MLPPTKATWPRVGVATAIYLGITRLVMPHYGYETPYLIGEGLLIFAAIIIVEQLSLAAVYYWPRTKTKVEDSQ
jgi:hypothetical protein